MIDDEMAPAPSREALLADLVALSNDFGRLFATDCEALLLTERAYWPSRYPEPRDPAAPLWGSDPGWERILCGAGLDVAPAPMRSAEDANGGSVFYDRAGRPVVNSVGESLIGAPGWADVHSIRLKGPGSLRASESIDRANRWAIEAANDLAPILWPGKSMTFRSFCWPDVVAGVADLAGRSTLKPSDWYVTAAGQSYSLMVWRRRVDFELGGPMVPSEVADRIGDEPENIWAKRPAFLRDCETAAQWLIDRLAESVGDEIEPDDRDAIGSAALNAVVAGGLAGVLQAAVGARSVDRVTALIRERVKADFRLYWLRADDWADQLRVAKKTVTGSKGWREVMAWRAANKADRVSNPVSKKTGK